MVAGKTSGKAATTASAVSSKHSPQFYGKLWSSYSILLGWQMFCETNLDAVYPALVSAGKGSELCANSKANMNYFLEGGSVANRATSSSCKLSPLTILSIPVLVLSHSATTWPI